jgi:predicted TIM-barrel fold metal-dependent hydrolase
MIVDIHTHFNEPGIAEKLGIDMRKPSPNYPTFPSSQMAEFGQFDKQIEVNEKAGIDKRLMSSPFGAEMMSAMTDRSSLDVVKAVNDSVVKTVERKPDRLWGMGTVNPLEKDHIKEAERCMGPLKFKGLLCTTSWHGRFPTRSGNGRRTPGRRSSCTRCARRSATRTRWTNTSSTS